MRQKHICDFENGHTAQVNEHSKELGETDTGMTEYPLLVGIICIFIDLGGCYGVGHSRQEQTCFVLENIRH